MANDPKAWIKHMSPIKGWGARDKLVMFKMEDGRVFAGRVEEVVDRQVSMSELINKYEAVDSNG